MSEAALAAVAQRQRNRRVGWIVFAFMLFLYTMSVIGVLVLN